MTEPAPEAARAVSLPHRFPFLLIDRIVELVPGSICVAETAVTGDAFQGARPGPLPATLLVEMLCQACGLLGSPPESDATEAMSDGARWGGRLAALRDVRFSRPARPGETITLTVRRLGGFGSASRFAGVAAAAGETLAEGELILGGR